MQAFNLSSIFSLENKETFKLTFEIASAVNGQ